MCPPTTSLPDMAPKPFLLTCPSSRGIGLALTRRLLVKSTLPVVATARSDLDGTRQRILDGLEIDSKRLEVLEVDVTGRRSSSISHICLIVVNLVRTDSISTSPLRYGPCCARTVKYFKFQFTINIIDLVHSHLLARCRNIPKLFIGHTSLTFPPR